MGISPSMFVDEIPEETLEAELELRRKRRELGLCDYCARMPDTKPCKFPSRHSDDRIRERQDAH